MSDEPDVNYDSVLRRDFRDGELYQQWAVRVLRECGRVEPGELTMTFKEQKEIGETTGGYEIKFDRKFARTARFFVETEARHRPKDKYRPAGPFKASEKYYVMGCTREIVVFATRQLRDESRARATLPKQSGGIFEIAMKTAKGFWLDQNDICRLALWQTFPGQELREEAVRLGLRAADSWYDESAHLVLESISGPSDAPQPVDVWSARQKLVDELADDERRWAKFEEHHGRPASPPGHVTRYPEGHPYAGFAMPTGRTIDPLRAKKCVDEAEAYRRARDKWASQFSRRRHK
jgi:hypothetical protein